MSWPIGYGNTGFRFRASLDGAIFAQDVQVSEVNGWLTVPVPRTSQGPETTEISVRLRLSADARGNAFLYAEQVEVGGRRFSGVHALTLANGPEWIKPLPRCVLDEIARRVAAGPHAVETRSTSATLPTLRATTPMKSPDDTWEGMDALTPPRMTRGERM